MTVAINRESITEGFQQDNAKLPSSVPVLPSLNPDHAPSLANKTVKTLETLVDERIQAANQKAQVWEKRVKAFALLTLILALALAVILGGGILPSSALGFALSMSFSTATIMASGMALKVSLEENHIYNIKSEKLIEINKHNQFNTIKHLTIPENANGEDIKKFLQGIIDTYRAKEKANEQAKLTKELLIKLIRLINTQ